MTTAEAIKYFGGRKGMAQALDIWPHAISRWGERPPELQQYRIEILSGGELKADRRWALERVERARQG